jgi:hypothetical protein
LRTESILCGKLTHQLLLHLSQMLGLLRLGHGLEPRILQQVVPGLCKLLLLCHGEAELLLGRSIWGV